MNNIADGRVDGDGTISPMVRDCLRAAIAAPSIHNTQPWRFRLHDEVIDVFADDTRRLDVIDPRGREMHLSVGACLLNLRVTLLAHGRLPVSRLLPSVAEPDLVARVRAGIPAEITETTRLLAQAIPRRHTNRRPFADLAVAEPVLHELAEAASVEGGHLIVADAGMREAVLSLTRTAENRQQRERRYWRELAEWTRYTAGRHDGVPPEAYGPWSAWETIPIRDFGLIEPARKRTVQEFEPEPTIGILYADGDTRRDWLIAGQALERVLLTATVRGVATTLMTQPLEIPELRALMADVTRDRVAQAIIRFGYGPPSPTTPRRPLEEVVEGLTAEIPHHPDLAGR